MRKVFEHGLVWSGVFEIFFGNFRYITIWLLAYPSRRYLLGMASIYLCPEKGERFL